MTTNLSHCEQYIVGSPYSHKGTNRFDLCHHWAKYRVTHQDGTIVAVCGIHARKYINFNAQACR